MNRTDFQKLAKLRIREGRVLLKNNHFDGAFYLLGYAIECAIKACISKQTKKYDFPDLGKSKDCYNHNLEKLMNVAGLSIHLNNEIKANNSFRINWNIVKDWSEEYRYKNTIAHLQAKDFYSAITDRRNGVFQWLKKYW